MHIVGSFGKFKRAMLRKLTRNVLLAARKEDRIGRRLTKLSVLPQHVILLLVEPQKKIAADAARLFNVRPSTVSRLLKKKPPINRS